MEKHFLDRQTRDGAQLTIEQIAAICPSAITEVQDENTGEIVRKVNFTTLRQLLGDLSVETPHEAYDFTWVGKTAARREAAMPISQTLRPCPEESVDWDNTKNLYIEGDNLQVLKLLQNYYAGQIKMIYIDPPYNTGKDFVYHDDFHQTQSEYEEAAGIRDELGNRFYVNNDSNGRFHSDWCSMIYARLLASRTLLSDDGVIFISIDDNEVRNLKNIGDEVFGEDNFVGIVTVKGNPRGRQSSSYFAQVHDFLLVYRKSPALELAGFAISEEEVKKRFNKSDENGAFEEWELRKRGAASRREDVPTLYYPIYFSTTSQVISTTEFPGCDVVVTPKLSDGSDGRWRWSREKVEAEKEKLYVRKNTKGVYNVYERKVLSEKSTQLASTIWDYADVNTELGTKLVKALFDGAGYFDFPKPIGLLNRILQIIDDKNALVLDFFSGSATTAHAVMLLNAEDGGNRKFIMVQLPELTPEDSEARKAGYETICEIGKERIRRAGKQIKESAGLYANDLDTGFRVLKLDESNFKQVSFAAKDYSQAELAGLIDNIKEDRSDLDLLFDCMLRWGVELSLPIVRSEADHCHILNVNDGDLVACLAPNETITEAVIDAIAAMHPLRIVLRDTAFEEASQKMNIYELFKQRLGWSDDQASKQIRVI